MSRRVAVVTGANKGIGVGIVRNLCQQFDGDVILTSRNVELGKAAQLKLETEENLHPLYHQLDITDHDSIVRLHDYLKTNYNGLDVLVNNAAIAYSRGENDTPFGEQAEQTLKINFFGTLDACRVLFPLLRPHARVVNVSSRVGNLGVISGTKLKDRLLSNELTMPELDALMKDFVELSKTVPTEQLSEHGYNINRGVFGAYAVSKVGVTIMTRILQRELDAERKNDDDIVVNAACPGYINTDMTNHRGWGTIEKGADTITYLALLPPSESTSTTTTTTTILPRGQFVAERRVIDYDNFFMSLKSMEMWRVGGRLLYSSFCSIM